MITCICPDVKKNFIDSPKKFLVDLGDSIYDRNGNDSNFIGSGDNVYCWLSSVCL